LTFYNEIRFQCNRCHFEEIVPVQNTPITTRFHAPQGWTTLKVDDKELQAHLCPTCSDLFVSLMAGLPRAKE